MSELPDGITPEDVELIEPLYREWLRIFGDPPAGPSRVTVLPLVSSVEALAFFRTVPSGTPFGELGRLALEWRAEHPTPITVEDEDRDPAG